MKNQWHKVLFIVFEYFIIQDSEFIKLNIVACIIL